jgi:hypothetical protein
VVHGDLNGRIADDNISTNDVSLNSRSQMNPVRITDHLIIFDRIIGVGG